MSVKINSCFIEWKRMTRIYVLAQLVILPRAMLPNRREVRGLWSILLV